MSEGDTRTSDGREGQRVFVDSYLRPMRFDGVDQDGLYLCSDERGTIRVKAEHVHFEGGQRASDVLDPVAFVDLLTEHFGDGFAFQATNMSHHPVAKAYYAAWAAGVQATIDLRRATPSPEVEAAATLAANEYNTPSLVAVLRQRLSTQEEAFGGDVRFDAVIDEVERRLTPTPEVEAETRRLTLEGHIVISVGLFGHVEGLDMGTDEEPSEIKRMLDALHLRKIDLSDRVHVIDVAGYIGTSTAREIAYAEATGKLVTYLASLGVKP